jgi:hypothetical protein
VDEIHVVSGVGFMEDDFVLGIVLLDNGLLDLCKLFVGKAREERDISQQSVLGSPLHGYFRIGGPGKLILSANIGLSSPG